MSDTLQGVFKTSSKRLEDMLTNPVYLQWYDLKTSWRHLEDSLNTYWRRLKTSWNIFARQMIAGKFCRNFVSIWFMLFWKFKLEIKMCVTSFDITWQENKRCGLQGRQKFFGFTPGRQILFFRDPVKIIYFNCSSKILKKQENVDMEKGLFIIGAVKLAHYKNYNILSNCSRTLLHHNMKKNFRIIEKILCNYIVFVMWH